MGLAAIDLVDLHRTCRNLRLANSPCFLMPLIPLTTLLPPPPPPLNLVAKTKELVLSLWPTFPDQMTRAGAEQATGTVFWDIQGLTAVFSLLDPQGNPSEVEGGNDLSGPLPSFLLNED